MINMNLLVVVTPLYIYQHESLDGEAKGVSADIMGARAYG